MFAASPMTCAPRPSPLEDLGLLGALQHEAARLTQRLDGCPLVVSVDAAGHLLFLSPIVEAASYRIVAEALTNVARHSTASSVKVRLRVDNAVCIDITDNGPPGSEPWSPGFGLSSMRQRVIDLGGRFDAGPSASGGMVHAELPLQIPEGQE
jgi:two-component system NarL family sensor kinase